MTCDPKWQLLFEYIKMPKEKMILDIVLFSTLSIKASGICHLSKLSAKCFLF